MDSEMILQYERLVYALSRKFYGAPKEDIVQAGFLGLTKAYKNYKPDANVQFSTYAYQYIFGEMYELANGSRPLRVDKSAMRLYKSVIRMQEVLTQKYSRSVSILETCEYLGVDYDVIESVLSSLSQSISIENTELNLTREEKIDDMILLKESLMRLSDIEKSVIENRYLNDLSQDETAKKMGLTQVNVSRIERRSKEKMKEFIKS